ncbi:MAG: hypothetical protein ACYTEQ_15660 [Planctomycetota bacterium]|jgi:hypothetical protein
MASREYVAHVCATCPFSLRCWAGRDICFCIDCYVCVVISEQRIQVGKASEMGWIDAFDLFKCSVLPRARFATISPESCPNCTPDDYAGHRIRHWTEGKDG